MRKKKGASLSAILNLSHSENYGGQLSDTTQVNTKNNSQLERPYARKSLFDHRSRDVISLKRQVPLAKVREFLAGSGKYSENSNHFDKSLAQYFRSHKLGRKTRNANNSMTENIKAKDVDPVSHDTVSVQNKS